MFLKKLRDHKVFCLFVLLSVVMAANVFAGSGSSSSVDTTDMDGTVNAIVDFFNGAWVKGICCVLLIGECLGLLFAGGQNPQIMKKFLPFIIGTVLFMCAGKIINIIFSTHTTNFSDDLGMILIPLETISSFIA